MSERYLMSQQVIPGKGMSYTYYEIEGEDKIIRMLTHIPEVGQVSIYPKPPVKKLFAPDRCEQVEDSVFKDLWTEGEKLAGK